MSQMVKKSTSSTLGSLIGCQMAFHSYFSTEVYVMGNPSQLFYLRVLDIHSRRQIETHDEFAHTVHDMEFIKSISNERKSAPCSYIEQNRKIDFKRCLMMKSTITSSTTI